MTLTMRSWSFALRRGCGKWYSLALVAIFFVIAFGASLVLDEPEIMTWSCFFTVLIYGGAVVLASYFANRSQLHPLRPSLSEMRAGRIPVFAELRKYRGLLLLIVVAPFILGSGVLTLDYLLTIFDAGYGIIVLVLGSGIILAVLTAFMYWLFRSEVEH